uniref:SPK domain-containing protein n=1 Tax=Caenorhabditis tropicalis TaxID=1561998 RepID=A0A1I7SZA9_9PELO
MHTMLPEVDEEEGGLNLNEKEHLSGTEKQLIDFLVEKMKTMDSPIGDTIFLKEFKKATGFPDSIDTLKRKYRSAKSKIFDSKEFDREMKIRMLFVSGARLNAEILKDLRKHALVTTDKLGKIKEYVADDGSVSMKRGRSGRKTVSEHTDRLLLNDENRSVSFIPITNMFMKEFEKMKRASEEIIYLDDEEEEETAEEEDKKPVITEEHPFIDLTIDSTEEDVSEAAPMSKKRRNEEISTGLPIKKERTSRENTFDSFGFIGFEEPVAQNQQTLEKEMEEAPEGTPEESPLTPITSTPLHTLPDDLFDVEASISNLLEPIELCRYLDDDEELDFEFGENGEEETPKEPETHTALLKVLEAFDTLIATLESPILSELKAKIEARIAEEKESSRNIRIDSIPVAIEPCLYLLQKNSTEEFNDSTSLRDFLIILRCHILGLKIPELDDYQKKLKGNIDSLSLQDKRIPLNAIPNALQLALDIIVAT